MTGPAGPAGKSHDHTTDARARALGMKVAHTGPASLHKRGMYWPLQHGAACALRAEPDQARPAQRAPERGAHPDGQALARGGARVAARLDKAGVQQDVVRHHRRACAAQPCSRARPRPAHGPDHHRQVQDCADSAHAKRHAASALRQRVGAHGWPLVRRWCQVRACMGGWHHAPPRKYAEAEGAGALNAAGGELREPVLGSTQARGRAPTMPIATYSIPGSLMMTGSGMRPLATSSQSGLTTASSYLCHPRHDLVRPPGKPELTRKWVPHGDSQAVHGTCAPGLLLRPALHNASRHVLPPEARAHALVRCNKPGQCMHTRTSVP